MSRGRGVRTQKFFFPTEPVSPSSRRSKESGFVSSSTLQRSPFPRFLSTFSHPSRSRRRQGKIPPIPTLAPPTHSGRVASLGQQLSVLQWQGHGEGVLCSTDPRLVIIGRATLKPPPNPGHPPSVQGLSLPPSRFHLRCPSLALSPSPNPPATVTTGQQPDPKPPSPRASGRSGRPSLLEAN